MKKTGVVRRWDAARGFGFIRSEGQADVFFHIRDFRGAGGPPSEGMAVGFDEIHVGGKGPRAMAVHPRADGDAGGTSRSAPRPAARAAPRQPPSRHGAAPDGGARWVPWLVLPWLALLGAGLWLHRLPWWGVAAIAVLNVLTLFAYAFDKDAAQKGRWRTQESTLHLFALLGGWPAAGLAQRMLRHKSSKAAFLRVYAATAVLHCTALAAWIFWWAPLGTL